MNYINFNVESRSIQDDVCDVWDISHTHTKKTTDEKPLLKMQMPLSGFRNYCLHITSSILFRDLMFTIRPSVGWALSMRSFVYTKDSVKLSNECSMIEDESKVKFLQNKLENVIERVQNGESRDNAKQDLPMMTSIQFDIMVGHRHLVNWLYALKLHIPRYFEFVKDYFFKACNFTEELFNETKKVDIWNYLALTPKELGYKDIHETRVLDVHALFTEVQCNLLAQFIRQNQSVVKNGLYNICNEDLDKALTMLSNSLVKCGAYITTDSLNYLTSKRSCWFAQFDDNNKSSWAYLLGDAISKMSVDEFMKNLPCGGVACNCDVKQDMVNRANREDLSPPCPIFIESSEMSDIRYKQYKKTSALTEMWSKVCDTIYNNPNNEYNKAYFQNEESK